MLPVRSQLGIPKRDAKPNLGLALVALVAGSFLSTGCNTMPVSAAPAAQPSGQPVHQNTSVQISPMNPSLALGAKMQFAALLSNTSSTAVTWSASGGSITSGGLFTAPTEASTAAITITASSVSQPDIQSSTAVVITNTVLAITTTSLPVATVGTPYPGTVNATGGQAPYKWTITSGSLPGGLQLNATSGAFSGSPTQIGTFQFGVQAKDSAGNVALQNLSLTASSKSNCGPPAYRCSRTDLDIVQVPASVPNMGNLSGANTIVTDPDFGNRIVRITDANTNPKASFKNRTYSSASSGSADENLWNLDSSLFVVQDSGANTYPFTFNAATMQAARMYVSSSPDSNGLVIPYAADWSRVNGNLLYAFSGTAISKYDFSNRSTPPLPQPVYDFTSSSNCLPLGFAETWKSKGGESSDDTVFGVAYSNAGGQGTGVYAVAYKVGSGCSMLNTRTGQVIGDWGSKARFQLLTAGPFTT